MQKAIRFAFLYSDLFLKCLSLHVGTFVLTKMEKHHISDDSGNLAHLIFENFVTVMQPLSNSGFKFIPAVFMENIETL